MSEVECGSYGAQSAFLASECGGSVVLKNLDCDREWNPILKIVQGLDPNLGGDTRQVVEEFEVPSG